MHLWRRIDWELAAHLHGRFIRVSGRRGRLLGEGGCRGREVVELLLGRLLLHHGRRHLLLHHGWWHLLLHRRWLHLLLLHHGRSHLLLHRWWLELLHLVRLPAANIYLGRAPPGKRILLWRSERISRRRTSEIDCWRYALPLRIDENLTSSEGIRDRRSPVRPFDLRRRIK